MSAFTDSFTRTNSTTALSNGWTALIGTWGINTNQAYNPSATGTGDGAVAYQDVENSDGTVQVTIPSTLTNDVGQAGIAFRIVDSNNYWIAGVYEGGAVWGVFINKWVAGSATTLASGSISAPSFPLICAVVLSGNSVDFRLAGVSKATASDAFNVTATKHGMMLALSSSYRLDDFSWSGSARPGALLHVPARNTTVRVSRAGAQVV